MPLRKFAFVPLPSRSFFSSPACGTSTIRTDSHLSRQVQTQVPYSLPTYGYLASTLTIILTPKLPTSASTLPRVATGTEVHEHLVKPVRESNPLVLLVFRVFAPYGLHHTFKVYRHNFGVHIGLWCAAVKPQTLPSKILGSVADDIPALWSIHGVEVTLPKTNQVGLPLFRPPGHLPSVVPTHKIHQMQGFLNRSDNVREMEVVTFRELSMNKRNVVTSPLSSVS